MNTLFSKKLAFATAGLTVVQTLPMNADWKGICTAIITAAFLVTQAAVDIFGKPEPPPVEAKKETP